MRFDLTLLFGFAALNVAQALPSLSPELLPAVPAIQDHHTDVMNQRSEYLNWHEAYLSFSF